MVIDEVRRKAYLRAMKGRITRESRVLDLGCGTGFFTLAALEMGAKHVVGVEVLDSVRLLPKVVAANGYEDRCELYEGDVRDLDMSPFDLVISDMRGAVPLYGEHLDVLTHVHQHLLHPDAELLPRRDRLRASLVSLPEWYDRQVAPWNIDSHDWAPYQELVLSSPVRRSRIAHEACASAPIEWGAVDYHDLESLAQRHFGGGFDTHALHDGEVHGIALWFDAAIADGVEYSTEPSDYAPTYGRMFHPFAQPLLLRANEPISVQIAAHRTATGWSWEWGASSAAGTRRHSSLDSLLLTADQLNTRKDGRAERLL